MIEITTWIQINQLQPADADLLNPLKKARFSWEVR